MQILKIIRKKMNYKRCLGIGMMLVFGIMSCSKVQYTNLETSPEISPSKDFVLLSISEEVPKEAIKIADVEYRESWNDEYNYLWNKLKKIALDKNATILKIKEVHTGNMKTKGAAMRILGSIYTYNKLEELKYADSLNTFKVKDTTQKIVLYFYRTDWGGPSLYDINVFINAEHHAKLVKRDVEKIELDQEGEIIISNTKNTTNGLRIKVEYGKKYFIQATQIVNSMASGTSLSIGVGPQKFILKNEQQGLFEYDTVKFRLENGYK